VPTTLELGGKSPVIIGDTADMALTAKRVMMGKTLNAGQICLAPDYVMVPKDKAKDFINEATGAVATMFPTLKDNPDYTSVINQRHYDRLMGYLDDARSKGAEIIELNPAKENFSQQPFHKIPPTIVLNPTDDMKIMKDEIFGPILPVLSFDSFDEAKAIIDRNPDPLAFYVYTSSDKKEKEWLEKIPAGGACVNNSSWHLTNHYLPFGGRGNSGIGQYHGRNSFEVFSHRKAVMKTPTWFDPDIKYPPFKGKLWLFKKVIR